MTKFCTGREARSHVQGLHLFDSNARTSPGSRVAVTTGHVIPELERELISRDASNVLRQFLAATPFTAVLRNSCDAR